MKKILLFSLIMSNIIYGVDLKRPKEYSIKYLHNFGDINGFVQIPKGGKFGTTTTRKPEFNDLGIDEINYPKFELSAKWDKFFVNTEINYKVFKGSSNLNYDLISHDQLITKNSNIKTNHEYINYNFGMGYDLVSLKNITISPLFQFGVTQFDYQYKTDNISSGRKFGFGSLHLGTIFKYDVTEKYNLILNLKYAIPFDNIRKWGTLELLNSYNILKNDSNELNLLFGIGMEYFEFRDTQKEMQNFMKHKVSPIYKIGLEYKF